MRNFVIKMKYIATLLIIFCQTSFSFCYTRSDVPENQRMKLNQVSHVKTRHIFNFKNDGKVTKQYRICFIAELEQKQQKLTDQQCETLELKPGESSGEQYREFSYDVKTISDNDVELTAYTNTFGECPDSKNWSYLKEAPPSKFIQFLEKNVYFTIRLGG